MRNHSSKQTIALLCAVGMLSILATSAPALGNQTLRFADVATDPSVGLSSFKRTPSDRETIALGYLLDSITQPVNVDQTLLGTPMRQRGIPGVALFDYDNDGDLDMYVTNGPGSPNALFQNQLTESGHMSFVDVSSSAGVEAMVQDSNGTCFGDIDNDGDHDLMVVGHDSPPILFENQGDGTFADISASAAIDSGTYGMACAMGDVNNDGRLDIFVSRAYDLNSLNECFFDFASPSIQPNDLFLNSGNNTFADVSATSGIRDVVSDVPGLNTLTWTATLIDYDLDGDLDILTADDQCNFPQANFGGFTRGTIQLFKNDGTGQFTNHTQQAGLYVPSAWMGFSWGDFNHDGHLDFFVPSFGDWGKIAAGAPVRLGDETSRWYLGDGQGGFTDPGVGQLQRTPFGWGTSAEDFDLDGDTDIVFYGGLDMVGFIEKSNPGALLLNDGQANFSYDDTVMGRHHQRRNDSGVAAGDLDNDGDVDIVSVSNYNIPAPLPLIPYSSAGVYYPGGPFEPAAMVSVMNPVERTSLASWNGTYFPNGTIALDLNEPPSANKSVHVTVMGTKGLLPTSINNRDGIGATLFFTPKRGKTAAKPVLGGSSHVSQDSLGQTFGLGRKNKGVLEILWPGGVRNKLFDVRRDERVLFPEIPCSYDDTSMTTPQYKQCVIAALDSLQQQGVITRQMNNRLFKSAMRAR